MSKYDEEICARLAAEAREDDERMEQAPWSVSKDTDGRGRRMWPEVSSEDTAGFVINDDCVSHPASFAKCDATADGIARTRNNLRAMADQLDAARALIDDLKGVDATEAFLQLRELGRLLSERDAARAEATRYRSLAEHYELCAKAYQRMKELDAICEAHPALADPVGQAAEVELMELCGKLQEYAMYIRTHTEGTP